MIVKVKLKNFKIHKNREFSFSNKNLILGENGTGKSSIFHAIVYGLFGSASLKYIGSTRVSTLVREFSSEAEITLEITNNGNNYTIKRVLRKDGNSYATLSTNNNVIATSQKLVDKKIKELFNINRESKILDTLYIPQGDLGKFILQSGTKSLTNLIEKLFDLDYYSTMLEAVKKVCKDIAIEIEKLNTLVYQKEKEIQKFKRIYSDLSIEDLEKMVEEYNKLFSEYNKLLQIYNKLSALKSNINFELIGKETQIKEEVSKIESNIQILEEDYSKTLAEIKSIEVKSIDHDLINIPIEDLSKLKEKIERELEDLSKEDLKIEIVRLEQIINMIKQYLSLSVDESAIEKLENEVSKIRSEISFLDSKISEINKVLEIIKEKKLNKCPVCGKDLSLEDLERLQKEKVRELSELKQKKTELINELKNRENLLRNLRLKYNKYLALKSRLEEENIDFNNIEDTLTILLQEYEKKTKLIDKFERLEKINNAINYLLKKDLQKKLEFIKQNLQNTRKKLFDKKSLLEKIKISKRYLDEYENILHSSGFSSEEEIEKRLHLLKDTLEKYKGLNPREVELYKLHIKELDEMKNKLQILKRNYRNLTTLQSVLERFIASYRKKLANKLSYMFNYFFKKLYKYQDIKEVKLEIKYERQEWKFYIYVMKNIDGKLVWREVKEANLSGGQIKILDLAFRLALAKVLNLNFYTLMLDEPTESLDENVRFSLAELLDSLKDYQIILCTHDELFKEKMTGNVIKLVRNENSQ